MIKRLYQYIKDYFITHYSLGYKINDLYQRVIKYERLVNFTYLKRVVYDNQYQANSLLVLVHKRHSELEEHLRLDTHNPLYTEYCNIILDRLYTTPVEIEDLKHKITYLANWAVKKDSKWAYPDIPIYTRY